MRTEAEILERITSLTDAADWMGTQRGDLIAALPFNTAMPYLTDKAVADGPEVWETGRVSTDDKVKEAIRGYLPFAIGKAVDHRGLSAGRSIDHMVSWLWLLGDDELIADIDDEYRPYGAPILAAIAAKYAPDAEGIDGAEFQRMATEGSCSDDCWDC